MSPYLLVAGIGAVIAVAGLILRKSFVGQFSIPTWLASGLACFLLGVGVSGGTLYQLGYHWEPQAPVIQQMGGSAPSMSGMAGGGGAGGGGMGGGGMGGGGMGGGGMGGGGMGGGGAGGGNRPAVTPAAITSLIRKLDLLERGVSIQLTAEQAAKFRHELESLEESNEISNETAELKVNALLAILTEEQRSVWDSVDPSRRGGAPGRGGSSSTAATLQNLPAEITKSAVAYGLSQQRPNPNANPFKNEENEKLLKSVRDRLAERSR